MKKGIILDLNYGDRLKKHDGCGIINSGWNLGIFIDSFFNGNIWETGVGVYE